MKRRAVGFIVDHPKRDLPTAVLLARGLADRGCDTYLIPLYEQATDVPLLPLDAIIVNYARPANFDLVQGYHDAGLPVFVLDTEGGNQTEAGANTPDRLATLLCERGFSKYLSGYFFWGPKLQEAFVERCGMSENTLITTGCPRFDYTSSRWRAALRYPHQNFVLINTNYPLVNPLFSHSQSKEIASTVAAGWGENYMKEIGDDMLQVFHSFKKTICKLAADLPDLKFIVRPHPFENLMAYKDSFNELNNIIVDGKGSVLNVLAKARCLLHLNCATAVEATMLERLPISLEYLNTPRLLKHAPLPSRISAQAHSYEQLLDMVRNANSYAEKFLFEKNYSKYIHPWFYKNDGRSADRLADAVVAHVQSRNRPISIMRSLKGSRRDSRTYQILQSCIANLLGSLAMSRFRSTIEPVRRDKLFSPAYVEFELKRLYKLEKGALPKVNRARHPLTCLPLASVVCRAV